MNIVYFQCSHHTIIFPKVAFPNNQNAVNNFRVDITSSCTKIKISYVLSSLTWISIMSECETNLLLVTFVKCYGQYLPLRVRVEEGFYGNNER